MIKHYAGLMASPKLEPLVLSDRERQILEGWARRRTTAQGLVLRSRIVLACAGGAAVSSVARQLGISRATAAKWRSRFVQGRLGGLNDQPRPGRPRTITDERAHQVIAATLQQEPPGGAHWSTRSMAYRAGMSQTTISRIWQNSGLRPHLAQAREPGTGPAPASQSRETSASYREQINNSTHDMDTTGQASPAHNRANRKRNTILAAERREVLLTRLHRDGKLIARDLAAELGLSEDSVRRDLRELAAAGLCQRVYGGALPISPALGTQASRSGIAPDSKRRVAAAAARLITPGTTVILDGGTTALEVAKALSPELEATIITHSATTAAALAAHPRVNIFLLGGQLRKQSVSASGAIAAEAASGITADLALLITPGIHPAEGLTHADPEDAALARILATRAADTYVMASIEKLGTVCAYRITSLSDVAGIITDAPASHPVVQELRNQGVTIIAA
jgi:DeoR/GlpR family transcriptional regulator of sugar metabolism/transposase